MARGVLLSTLSPLKPPFSLIPSAKCLIVRDCQDKRLRFYIVVVRLSFTIFVTFWLKMAIFLFLYEKKNGAIHTIHSFDNGNFENLKFPSILTLLCSNFQPLRTLLLFLCCVRRLRCKIATKVINIRKKSACTIRNSTKSIGNAEKAKFQKNMLRN